ncbi:MAG: transglutaminase family protein [Actinomycetota bacterium]|nr:MAG: transglutaminase family protein [Actinomycetota bacterium]
MTIKVALEHRTTYRFDRLIGLGAHVVRLRPAPHCRTPVEAYSLTVSPADAFVNWQQDPFGNHLARLVFPQRTTELSITVDLVATMTVINPFDFFVAEQAETYPFGYDRDLAADLAPYLRPVTEPGRSEPGPLLRRWLHGIRPPTTPMRTVDFLVAVNQRVYQSVAYDVRLEAGVQSPDTTLQRAIGSCRDSAWLLVAILRELGLAARFVSGYLVQLAPDVEALDGPTGPRQDFTDLHAWAEVYLPGAGWVGLDPTSGLFAGEGHIPLAASPEPATAAPVTGVVEPCEVELTYRNTVRRIHEDPRVTRPYTDQQWARVNEFGLAVDARLAAGDVRLTMGGEPTFVSIDDMDGAQWSTEAHGDAKRERAGELVAALRERWAPGGLVHHGQGKWYPGEPLPRWQLGLTWRTDGEPVWRDAALLADPLVAGTAGPDDAAEFVRGVAAALGIPATFAIPAYEDPLAQLLAEARLPDGAPPADDGLDAALDPADPDPAASARVLATLDERRGEPVGWVLPLHRTEQTGSHAEPGWATTRWQTRRRHLYLAPGTSPMGLRLPLDSLSWTAPPYLPEPSPLQPLSPLPPATAPYAADTPPAAAVVPGEGAPTTALCVELCDGRLHVFLPPVADLAPALHLVSVVEATAAVLGQAVVVEGYPLPADPRTPTVVVAPDPGVLEVNVHPAASWPELVATTEDLHAEARAVRLGTEKFALDGVHTGTGGGSHLTLGGPTPADSPLLRRPDLLRSLVTYWQHHPALSYLFAGRFIGPTSQAPRVDEGRAENLYELEIAFAELDRLADDPPPWLVDRLLRHLLTDITGNTHRAEFCIDKLYSPDSVRGRLGLLEMRAFEMPPHPRMGLVQALLVRALVARCWETPYAGRLVRWGSELTDRFLLPAYVEADIGDVVEDLRAHDLPFELGWLDPFLEFRFPRLGRVQVGEVGIELRRAIEPWHVLGEEATGAGTARYVDSSLERVQVEVTGLTPGRHVVTCNGVPLPLRPGPVEGVAVAGVRYRAWQPWSALHPTIAVQAPLVFDLVDCWNGRSLGGCTHHVVHPGGRAYDRLPVNANEAEARRVSRFEPRGHTPGPIDLSRFAALAAAPESGRTLDLRRTPRT